MRAIAQLSVGVLLLAALAGCQPNIEKEVVGTWKGSMDMSAGEGQAEGLGALAQGFANAFMPEFDIRADKTFTMKFMGIPVEGTWKVDGKDVVMTRNLNQMGTNSSSNNEPIRLTVNKDVTELTMVDDGQTITYSRVTE